MIGAMAAYNGGTWPMLHILFEPSQIISLGRCTSTWFGCECLKIKNNSSSNKINVYFSLA